MPRQRFAGDHQIAGLQRIMGAAKARRHALPQPPGLAERADPAPAGRIDVAVGALPVLDFGGLGRRPLIQLIGESAVLRVKERQAQMRGPAHGVLSPGQTR